MKALVIDTETGGINDRKHSILSIAGVLWELNKEPLPLFNFYVREPEVIITEDAFNVNGITKKIIKQQGIKPSFAVKVIRFALEVFDKKPVRLIGHNIGFDVGFLKRLYNFTDFKYEEDFSKHVIDTSSILSFFMLGNHLPEKSPCSDLLFKYCKVEIPKFDRHTAKGDAIATAKSMNTLIEYFKK